MGNKRTKNQIRRERAKLRKLEKPADVEVNVKPSSEGSKKPDSSHNNQNQHEQDDLEIDDIYSNPLFQVFEDVFLKFGKTGTTEEDRSLSTRGEVLNGSDTGSDSESDEDDQEAALSRRQLKQLNKPSLAALKSTVLRPQIVEWNDVDSPDPYLLVHFKSQVNVIPVPAHWSSKREYLSSRRGIQKPPFQLPKAIRDTGIQDMRNNNEEKTLKQLQRERVQPRSGKLDIDYQTLYNAFFKHQSKPRLYGFGDVYYEGKEVVDEHIDDAAKIRPGVISELLRNALGMPENDLSVPPPWISIMQYIGKPPAYENLIIPGIDTDYSNDGYKPPESEQADFNDVPKNWGKLVEMASSDEEYDEDEEEDEEDEENEDVGDADVEDSKGIEEESNSTVHYNVSGNDKPEVDVDVDSDKKVITEFGRGSAYLNTPEVENVSSDGDNGIQKSLYTVIEEKKETTSGFIQGEKKYVLDNRSQSNGKSNEVEHRERRKPTASAKLATDDFKF